MSQRREQSQPAKQRTAPRTKERATSAGGDRRPARETGPLKRKDRAIRLLESRAGADRATAAYNELVHADSKALDIEGDDDQWYKHLMRQLRRHGISWTREHCQKKSQAQSSKALSTTSDTSAEAWLHDADYSGDIMECPEDEKRGVSLSTNETAEKWLQMPQVSSQAILVLGPQKIFIDGCRATFGHFPVMWKSPGSTTAHRIFKPATLYQLSMDDADDIKCLAAPQQLDTAEVANIAQGVVHIQVTLHESQAGDTFKELYSSQFAGGAPVSSTIGKHNQRSGRNTKSPAHKKLDSELAEALATIVRSLVPEADMQSEFTRLQRFGSRPGHRLMRGTVAMDSDVAVMLQKHGGANGVQITRDYLGDANAREEEFQIFEVVWSRSKGTTTHEASAIALQFEECRGAIYDARNEVVGVKVKRSTEAAKEVYRQLRGEEQHAGERFRINDIPMRLATKVQLMQVLVKAGWTTQVLSVQYDRGSQEQKYVGVVKAADDPPQWEMSSGPGEILTIERQTKSSVAVKPSEQKVVLKAPKAKAPSTAVLWYETDPHLTAIPIVSARRFSLHA